MSGATIGSGTSVPGVELDQHEPQNRSRVFGRSCRRPAPRSSAVCAIVERVVVVDAVERAHPLERQHVGVEHADVVERAVGPGVARRASSWSGDRPRSRSCRAPARRCWRRRRSGLSSDGFGQHLVAGGERGRVAVLLAAADHRCGVPLGWRRRSSWRIGRGRGGVCAIARPAAAATARPRATARGAHRADDDTADAVAR